jgi:hypothetical protein
MSTDLIHRGSQLGTPYLRAPVGDGLGALLRAQCEPHPELVFASQVHW